ncbi:MAG: HesA/MoeB/ThiF family protein [Pseudomonadota bacterium]
MDEADFERYSRHINLAQVGFDGQLALSESHALVVGAGGLGCPAALYLASAGVGRLTLIDDDRVELSNLQRQIAHPTERVSAYKALSLAEACHAINPRLVVSPVIKRADAAELAVRVADATVVLDATDNLETRHAINRACVEQDTVLVSASAIRFEGQIAVLAARRGTGGCYRCVYPETLGDVENCQSAGVVGPLVGILGSYMALAALKQMVGIGTGDLGSLWLFDAAANHWQRMSIAQRTDCPVCGAYYAAPP